MSSAVDQYGVVGHPVGHSLSPFIHGMFARETGQDMTYRLYDVAPADFHDRVREFFAAGGRGLNITLPHKIAAVDLAQWRRQLGGESEPGERVTGDRGAGRLYPRDL